MTNKKFIVVVLMTTLLIVTSFVTSSRSQGSYPDRPITMVCPFTAGGISDLSGRALSKVVEKELGQPIIVENKPGAGGVIGKVFVLKQKPDGYTLGITGSSTYYITPNIRQVPYDPFTDITEIMIYLNAPFCLAVKADAPWNTFEELIAYVKGNPGKFTYSTGGIGLAQHICMERIGLKEGIKWTHIPFKGGPEAVIGTLGGHTHAVAQLLPDVFSHVKAGKLKLLLVLSESRFPDFPDIPTILEKDYDFSTFSNFGIFGPKGLQEPVRQKLETSFKNAIKDPFFIEAMKKLGIEPIFMSGSEFAAKWRSQYHEMGKTLKALGLVEK